MKDIMVTAPEREEKTGYVFSRSELETAAFPVFEQYGVKRAILFGSYAKGLATIYSDVDILVDSGLKGLRFVGLIEALKSVLGGKSVDLIDVSHVEKNSAIDLEIRQTGVLLYEK
ncbi:MAG: nucleotidyltransferase domain-containing protein [Clostridiales bacterium]|nr:nucleotidyltransferase domain-containing protein [Clostridiales bacterium]